MDKKAVKYFLRQKDRRMLLFLYPDIDQGVII